MPNILRPNPKLKSEEFVLDTGALEEPVLSAEYILGRLELATLGRLELDMLPARELAPLMLALALSGALEADAKLEARESLRSLTTLYSSAYASMVSSNAWTSAGRWWSSR